MNTLLEHATTTATHTHVAFPHKWYHIGNESPTICRDLTKPLPHTHTTSYKHTPTPLPHYSTHVVLGEELLGEGSTHAHSALHRGGTEVSLAHLSAGRGLVQVGFHCTHTHTRG
jgi:hypothetical protein